MILLARILQIVLFILFLNTIYKWFPLPELSVKELESLLLLAMSGFFGLAGDIETLKKGKLDR